MNILITGATGFIGSHIAKAISESNNIYALVRNNSNLLPIENFIKKTYTYSNSFESIYKVFLENRIDAVIHLASCIVNNHTPDDIEPLIDTNIKMGTYILEAMSANKCKIFINTSTYWQHYKNKDYCPLSIYAATKEAFEKVIDYYSDAKGINAVTLELYDTYGINDQRPKILNLIRDSYKENKILDMSAGEQEINLLYIDDIVSAYISALDLIHNSSSKGHNKYCIRAKKSIKLKELIAMIEHITDKKVPVMLGALPYRDREIMKIWDSTESLPGWEPEISYENGLKMFFDGSI